MLIKAGTLTSIVLVALKIAGAGATPAWPWWWTGIPLLVALGVLVFIMLMECMG